MSLLTAPFTSLGRRADGVADLLRPEAMTRRLRRLMHPRRGLVPVHAAGPEEPLRLGARAVRPDDRADRARTEAAAYLSRRRRELRRDLEARR